MLLLRKEAA